MRSLVIYLHMHQPYRVKNYSVFATGHDHDYWTDPNWYSRGNNQRILEKVAEKSYRPTLKLIERSLKKYPNFKISLSITGTFLEQVEAWTPDLIDSLKRIIATGRVEIVAETYYHSLAFFYDRSEFEAQVKAHQTKIQKLFGVKSQVFRNTELAYNNDLAKWAEDYGFKGILAEGWDKVLEWRSPNFVYTPADCKKIKLLLKNYRLSDDLAFRFSDKNWEEWPLTIDKYIHWLETATLKGPLINLFMDFETFGEHQWTDTGIFDFFEQLIHRWDRDPENRFLTTSEAINAYDSKGEISMAQTVTWADTERDLTAWLGNDMQREALTALYALKNDVIKSKDPKIKRDWRRLQTSDHVYYMCTKYFNDGDVHAYFSAYESPYDAFLYYMNAVRDLEYRIENLKEATKN